MNKAQRNKNRETARGLSKLSRQRQLSTHVCENCGQFGGHFVNVRPQSLEGIINGVDDSVGYWLCMKDENNAT